MSEITLDNLFIRGLACAALQRNLRNILVFNVPEEKLPIVAGLLEQMLQQTSRDSIKQDRIGSFEQEDDLWGYTLFPDSKSSTRLRKEPRLFSQKMNEHALQIIMIPNLTRLSLAVMRACVVLVGSEIASVQRHGQDESWETNYCWLAACEQDESGRVSPHLIDRFTMRLWWQDFPQGTDIYDQTVAIQNWLNTKEQPIAEAILLPEEIKQRLEKVAQQKVQLTSEALQFIIPPIQSDAAIHPRRDITLARLAVANAQLEGATSVAREHVEMAVKMLKLTEAASLDDESDKEPIDEIGPEPIEPSSAKTVEPVQPSAEPIQKTALGQDSVYAGTPAEHISVSMLPPAEPYPEDRAEYERELTPLHFPQINISVARAYKGNIVGVEPTDTLEDLAFVSTLFAAAPYQKIRTEKMSKRSSNGHIEEKSKKLLLTAADFRKYRHVPVSQLMLLLLLDYTSVRDIPLQEWITALMPYMQTAYIKRATICIVQVGIAHPQEKDSLRASRIMARSMLVPEVNKALVDLHGNATPLPHGLSLALQTMRQALQHGRSTVQHINLVVLTDGRANVPLSTSLTGEIFYSDQAIEDALEQARAINELRNVEKVLLSPPVKYYPELPMDLAEVLGASFKKIELPVIYERKDDRYE